MASEKLLVSSCSLKVQRGGLWGTGNKPCLDSCLSSAILYLNGDFDGGNFYFTELDAKTVTVSALLSSSLATEPCFVELMSPEDRITTGLPPHPTNTQPVPCPWARGFGI